MYDFIEWNPEQVAECAKSVMLQVRSSQKASSPQFLPALNTKKILTNLFKILIGRERSSNEQRTWCSYPRIDSLSHRIIHLVFRNIQRCANCCFLERYVQ